MTADTELTLAWINGFRASRGLQELTALPENKGPSKLSTRACSCPVAKALPGEPVTVVHGGCIDISGHKKLIFAPDYVVRTVARLDKELDLQ